MLEGKPPPAAPYPRNPALTRRGLPMAYFGIFITACFMSMIILFTVGILNHRSIQERTSDMDYQWQYRVVKRTFRQGHEHFDSISFSIYEVYRDEKDTIVAIAGRGTNPSGETADELKADVGAMMEAFQLPVLDYGQITEEIAKAKR